MRQEKKSRGIYWMLTAVSILAMILLLAFQPQWVWLSFPFVGTFFVSAMDVI